jgi:hypothetical protein
MANIGSVFLGDVQRNRLRSSASTPGSTPPSSPPPVSLTSHGPIHSPFPDLIHEQGKGKPPSQHYLAPMQSLELRVRWLEAILYGAKHDESLAGLRERKPGLKRGETLIRAAESTQQRMNDIASTYDVLRRFIGHYEQHAQYLTPAFALSGTLPTITPPDYKDMSPADLAALAAELEPDIRAADNDMREIDDLQRKGITGAGTLSDYEALQPRLEALLLRHQGDIDRAAALEKRVARIVRQYTMQVCMLLLPIWAQATVTYDCPTQVDSLSELFVAWDETLRVAEDRVGKLEKEQEERSRRGYD